jgi:hypothetical protein
MEVVAMQAIDELRMRIGDDHSHVDAVNAYSNVGSRLVGLLRASGRRQE